MSVAKNITEPRYIQYLLIGIVILFLLLVLVMPISVIFIEAFSGGLTLFKRSLLDPDALAAIKLTLMTTAIVLPINMLIGVSMAWLLTRFDFKGKTFLTTLLDIPFAVSPVIAGLMLVLLFGKDSWLGGYLEAMGIQVIYAVPGIILATLFVTFPFIARELIPLMQMQGSSEEQAALVLGAKPRHIFWKVTLPNIKWALIYGLILTNARAMGEFGAVSLVSGHIRGQTNTIPLQVEILYNEYNFTAAFALSSLLAILALLTIVVQHLLTWRQNQLLASSLGRNNMDN